MCEESELIVMVADSKEKSRDLMCEALGKLGLINLLCAFNTVHGLELSLAQGDNVNSISMLFVNSNLEGMPLDSFVNSVAKRHEGIITITYSNCIKPEAHMLAMFNAGSMDHIDQNGNFEERVVKVTSRWIRAAKLQFDYTQKYGHRHGNEQTA